MAQISYKQRECDTCGGRLIYQKEEKEYVCTYCGNRYEKTESYDGQYSVRHAALQALSAIAKRNYELAEDNLNDCQKIDPNYPGTIVARMSYCLLHAGMKQAEGDSLTSKNYINQAIEQYRKLPQAFDEIECDLEADFYENLDSEDIRSLLITNFGLFKDSARASYIDEMFDPSKVHGNATNALVREISQEDWEAVDALIGAQGKYDVDAFLGELLAKYPSGQQKSINVATVLSRGVEGDRARETLSNYLLSTQDDAATQASVVSSFAKMGISPEGHAAVHVIKQKPSAEDSLSIVKAVCEIPQRDSDVEVIVDGVLTSADNATIKSVIELLSTSGSYLAYQVSSLKVLACRADLSPDAKIDVIRTATRYGLTAKKEQALLGEVLESPLPIDAKKKLLAALGEDIKAINPTLIDRYLMHSSVDGIGKAEILETLIKYIPARESLSYSAKRYVAASVDSMETRNKVVAVLGREGLVEQADNLSGMLVGADQTYGIEATRDLKESGIKVGPMALNDYLAKALGTSEFSSQAFDELYTPESKATLEVFVKFVFDAPDSGDKAEHAGKLAKGLMGNLTGFRIKTDTPSGSFEGPLFHAYLLKTADGPKTVNDIAHLLLETARKPNCEITLNNKTKKFKKFVSSGEARLSEASAAFCSAMRIA